jgi:hypothetical protein
MNTGIKEAGMRMRMRILIDVKMCISSIVRKFLTIALWGTFMIRICNELTWKQMKHLWYQICS